LTHALTRQPDGWIARGAHVAAAERVLQFEERVTRGRLVRALALGKQTRNGGRKLRAHETPRGRYDATRPALAATIGRPNSRRTLKILSCEAGFGGTIGSRYDSSHKPIAAIANLTGPGLDSMKFTCMTGRSFWCQRRAVA
jgi:hypothetical protein